MALYFQSFLSSQDHKRLLSQVTMIESYHFMIVEEMKSRTFK